MPHKYSTALSHLVLAGTGIYCLHRYHQGTAWLTFPVGTFGIIITHSIIGVWRWGNPDHGDDVEKPYNGTQFLQTIFAMPFIAGQVWLNHGYQREIGYLHPGLSLIPLGAYLADKLRQDVVDVILALNVVSCAVISFTAENYYGIAAAVAFALNHFWIRDEQDVFDVPATDIYNYALCFFTFFALRSV